MSIMKRLLRQWKSRPQRMVMAAVFVCIVSAWLVLGLHMQLKWANWLFLPMLCIDGTMIFMNFRERKLRSAIAGISSFVILVSIAAESLLVPLNPEDLMRQTNLRMWITIACLAIVIVLSVVSFMIPKNAKDPIDTE